MINIIAEDISINKTAYVDREKLEGTMANLGITGTYDGTMSTEE